MARVDTLPHFLTDVADAIREKKGTSETIQASDFDTEIENLPSGGGASDYINTTISENTSQNSVAQIVKKMPTINIEDSVTSLQYCFRNFMQKVSRVIITGGKNVTDFSSAFGNCFIEEIDLSNFDGKNVTNLSSFRSEGGGGNVQKVIFGDFSSGSLRYLGYAFAYGSHSFEVVFGNNFNTTNVTSTSNMFMNNRGVTSVDMSMFETPNLQDTSSMFNNSTNLQHIDMRKCTFDSVINSSNMFSYIPQACEIIVKSQTEKDWVLNVRSDLTNVKTVAEYEAEQGA